MQRPPNGWPFVLLLSKALEDEWSSTGDDRSVSRNYRRLVVFGNHIAGDFLSHLGRRLADSVIPSLHSLGMSLVVSLRPTETPCPGCKVASMKRRTRCSGFTLIELMIVVALLAIFASIALPSFANLISNNRVEAARNELYSLLQFARTQAVSTRASVSVCQAGGVWTVRSKCSSTAILRQMTPPQNVSMSASASAVEFRSNGTVDAALAVVTCHNDELTSGYKISVQASGYIQQFPRGKDGDGTASLAACGF